MSTITDTDICLFFAYVYTPPYNITIAAKDKVVSCTQMVGRLKTYLINTSYTERNTMMRYIQDKPFPIKITIELIRSFNVYFIYLSFLDFVGMLQQYHNIFVP